MEDTQKQKILDLRKDYIDNGSLVFRVELDKYLPAKELDEKRVEVSKGINKLLSDLFSKKIDLSTFKSEVDGINKRNRLWGFKGMNGQMFFNMLYNRSEEKDLKEDLFNLLKETLLIPKDISDAKLKIKSMIKFIEILEKMIDSKQERPRKKSILFFLSYFWQIQDPKIFPIFYNSLEIVLKDLSLIKEEDYLEDYYQQFYNINLEIKELLSDNERVDLWFVEHVLWHYYNNNVRVAKPETEVIIIKEKIRKKEESSSDLFLPPIVADISLIAKNDEILQKNYSPKLLEDVFEEKIFYLFKILGFNTEKLGKGHRDADGIAQAKKHRFALVYDCKVRAKPFNLLADDERTLEEYIENNRKKLIREGIDRVYFLIISGEFTEPDNKLIKEIKIKSGANEIIFVRADQLLSILKKKMLDPSIDLDDIERIFCQSGLLEDQDIEELGA